ncbi:MAG: DNA methyltransferase [Acinetobacter sp.]
MASSTSIKKIKTIDLIPYANNSRTHSDEQVLQIASSIKEFGFLNPIIIDGDNGIIAGHGRVMAAKKLGIDELPCVDASHLTPAQKKAYVIADNKIALNSEWDVDALRVEFEALREMDFDVELTGFSLDEISELEIEEIAPEYEEDADGEVIEPPPEPKTKEGDVWILGKHRLMCGDSTSIDAVENLLNGAKIDLVFTDPPYGVEYQSNMRTKTQKFDMLKNDDEFLDIAPVIDATTKGWVFVWTSWKVQHKWIELFESFGDPSNIVIWHKPGGGIGDLKKTFISDYEVALVWHRGAELCGKRIGSVWKVAKDGASTYVHPTQKPVELSEEAVDKTTKNGASVLDLFGGSGSTLIGCEKTNRKAYLMELDPKYCDVIINRWQTLTGKEATLESTGETFNSMVTV